MKIIRFFVLMILLASLSSAQSPLYYSQELRSGQIHQWTNQQGGSVANITISILVDLWMVNTDDMRENTGKYVEYLVDGEEESASYDTIGRYIWEIYNNLDNNSDSSIFIYLHNLYKDSKSHNTILTDDTFYYNYTSYAFGGESIETHSQYQIDRDTGIIHYYHYMNYNSNSSQEIIYMGYNTNAPITFLYSSLFWNSLVLIPLIGVVRKKMK